MSKKNKTKSKDTSLDEKYNLIIRKISILPMQSIISEICSKYEEEFVFEVLNYMKDIYYTMDKEYCDGLVDQMYFMDMINYTEELFILAFSKKINVVDEISYFRKKFVSKLKENGIKFELFIYASKVGVLYENIKLYPKNLDFLYVEIVKSITDILFLFAQYITTYNCPFKNYEIDAFDFNDDGHVDIKYTKMPMLMLEHINIVNKYLNHETRFSDKYEVYVDKMSKQIHRAYANFMSRDIDKEYYDEFVGYLNLDKPYDFQLFDENKFILNDTEIMKIPYNRMYAIPSTGIRFEFLDKEKCVEHIDMKEGKEHINFNVYVNNTGGMSTCRLLSSEIGQVDMIGSGEESSLVKKEVIKSKIIKISFFIEKAELDKADTLEKKLETLRCVGYMPNLENFSCLFFENIRMVIFGCIYAAYYNPNVFNNELKLFHKTNNKKDGYTRQSGYRVEHLKKLPDGQHASSQAIAFGKQLGFDVPEGYTFVRASNLEEKEKSNKKVVKIK